MSFQKNLDIGRDGHCLAPGHPVKHTLKLECWTYLRNFLAGNPKASYEDYVEACKNKKR